MSYFYRSLPGFVLVALCIGTVQGQRLKKADKLILEEIDRHQAYLSGGNAAREAGQRMEYISKTFKTYGLVPTDSTGAYICSFEISKGVESAPASFLFINGDRIPSAKFIPLLKSPSVTLEAAPSLALREEGQPWFLDIRELSEQQSGGPQAVAPSAVQDSVKNRMNFSGSQLASGILERARSAREKGATALFIYNTSGRADLLTSGILEQEDSLPLAIVYVQPEIARKYFSDETAMLDIKLKVKFTEKKVRRNYVAGLINNHAPVTVVIRAADDAGNAPVLLELARSLESAKQKNKNKNYLLVAYSDEKEEDQKPGENGYESSFPLKADYLIEAGRLTGVDKLRYMYSILEKAR